MHFCLTRKGCVARYVLEQAGWTAADVTAAARAALEDARAGRSLIPEEPS